jgi:hypothetical protein
MRHHLLDGLVLGIVVLSLPASGSTTFAKEREPGWSGTVVARGEQRAAIEATNILHRPYRPFHIYGNTVRRQYYRGRSVPTAGDFLRGSTALFTPR